MINQISCSFFTRSRFFQPTDRAIKVLEAMFSTAHHDCQVSGRLGQVHCDLLEAIMFTYEKFQMVDDGGMALLVDHNKVRMTMSENQYSFSTMMNLYEDLMSARLRFWPHGRKEGLPESQETEQIEISGGIIDHVFKSDSEKRYNHLFGKVCSAEEFRNLAIVRMNTAYVTLLSMDPIKLHYDPRPIIRLGHGITKAVARYVLSHDIKRQPNNGWKLDTLIHAVAGEISGQPLLNARFRLKQETEALKKIGILITEENRVKRETIPLHNI